MHKDSWVSSDDFTQGLSPGFAMMGSVKNVQVKPSSTEKSYATGDAIKYCS